jgi:hypothetical protein
LSSSEFEHPVLVQASARFPGDSKRAPVVEG